VRLPNWANSFSLESFPYTYRTLHPWRGVRGRDFFSPSDEADMNEHEGLTRSDTRIVTAALPKRDMLRSAERGFYVSNLHC
jgi:hypothetical protein